MEEQLIAKYGHDGCYSAALIALHVDHEQNMIGSSMNNVSEIQQIGNLVETDYKSIAAKIEAVSWRLLVELGNIPDGIDAFIEKLKAVQNTVRSSLKKTLAWIGNNLDGMWSFIQRLIGSDWLDNMKRKLSFDWLVGVVTSAIKYTARIFASALISVLEALKNLIYNAINYMSDMFGGIMESVYNNAASSKESKKQVIKSLGFYFSCASDMPRYLMESKYVLENRLQAFKSQHVANIQTTIQVIEDNESVERLDSELGKTWFFEKSFGTMFSIGQSIVTWFYKHITWLFACLKRLVSAAKVCFDATYVYAYLFGSVFGSLMENVAAYAKKWQDPLTLSQAVENCKLMQNVPSLSKQRKDELSNAISMAEQVILDIKSKNDFTIQSRDNVKQTEQFRMNFKMAEALYQLTVDSETVDTKLVDEIITFYNGGQPLIDLYALHREALNVLEAQYTWALSELFPNKSSVKIGIKAKPSTGDEEDEEEEEETLISLQNKFQRAEDDLELAKQALITYETQLESTVIRDAKYMVHAKNLEKMLQKQNSTSLTIFQSENALTQMALMVTEQKEGPSNKEHLGLLVNLYQAFKIRNRLAKRLKKELDPVLKKRGKIAIASALFSTAAPVAFYFMLYMFLETPTQFTGESQPPTGMGMIFDFANTKILKGYLSQFSIPTMQALNVKLWLNVLEQFSTVSLDKVLALPHLFPYVAVLVTAIPVTIALSVGCYVALYCFGSMCVDVAYGVGVPKTANDKIIYDGQRFWFYMKNVISSLGIAFRYAFVRIASMWIGILGGQLQAVKGIIQGAPALIAAANPLSYLTEATAQLVPTQSKFDAFIQKTQLMPSSDVLNSILRPNGVDLESTIEIFDSIVDVLNRLPADHVLKTGQHVIERVKDRRAKVQGPKIEQLDSDEEDMPNLTFKPTFIKMS